MILCLFNELYARFSNPHIDTLLLETKKVYGDGSYLKEEFKNALQRSNILSDFQIPKIQTVITGFQERLVCKQLADHRWTGLLFG
ncbi:MAG: hypothetical protein U5K54_16815 [Cytophagales bacterium]|nr:hypothetical protein [Cytophagales bacterium]